MGNLSILKLNKEETAILEKKFKIFQNELMVKIRLFKVYQTVQTEYTTKALNRWIQWMQ